MLTSFSHNSSFTPQKYQFSAPKFQGSDSAESSKGKSKIASSNDLSSLRNDSELLKTANSGKPKVELTALSKSEKAKLKEKLNNARTQLQINLAKSKTESEKSCHRSNFQIDLYNAFYETVSKQAPEAKNSTAGDLHKLFSTLQDLLPAMSKVETFTFADIPVESQHNLLKSIGQGLNSSHEAVQQAAAEIGEGFGMTPDFLNRLKASTVQKKQGE